MGRIGKFGSELIHNTKHFERKMILILKSFFTNFIWLLVLKVFFTFAEKTDDMNVKNLLSGAFSGRVDSHILYGNYFLGIVLGFFQKLIPKYSWYEVSEYLLLFICFVILTYLVISKEDKFASFVLLAPFFLWGSFFVYARLAFTKTAGFSIAMGFLLVLLGISTKKINKKKTATGIIIILIGSLYRYEIVLMCAPFFFLAFLFEQAVSLKETNVNIGGGCHDQDKHELLHMLFPKGLILVGIVLGTICISKIGDVLYCKNEQWKNYKDYNILKVELQDYGWPDYSENEEEYLKIGISYNDWLLFSKGRDYGDRVSLSNKMMEEVIQLKKELESDVDRSFFRILDRFFIYYPWNWLETFAIILPITSVIMYMCCTESKKIFLVIGLGLIAFTEEFYMFYCGRHGKEHTDFCIWIAISIVLMYRILISSVLKERLFSAFLCFFSLTAINYSAQKTFIFSDTYYTVSNTVSSKEAKGTIEYINDNKESMFVFSNSQYYGVLAENNKVIRAQEKGRYDNIYVLSGIAYPPYKSVLNRYSVTNIYKEMAERDDIKYVTNNLDNAERILTYIQEHYYPNASYNIISNISDNICVIDFNTGIND